MLLKFFIFLNFFLYFNFFNLKAINSNDKKFDLSGFNFSISKIEKTGNLIEIDFTQEKIEKAKEKKEQIVKEKESNKPEEEKSDKENFKKNQETITEKKEAEQEKSIQKKEIKKELEFLKNTLFNKIFSFFKENSNSKKLVLNNAEILTLKSNFNDITYKLWVSLPSDYYQNTNQSYSVLYILDGHYSFTISHGIARFLHDKGLEKFILIGIGYDDSKQSFTTEQERIEFYNLNRTRDYTPVKSTAGTHIVKYESLSGGGLQFKEFLDKELIRFINSHYRTNNNNTLAGHSYGGLFAIWNYLNDNQNFKNYIAISPSCWYENFMIPKLVKNKKKFDSKIYFSVGEKETENMKVSVKATLKNLREIEPSRHKIKFETIKDENHETLFSSSFIHALLFLFKKENKNLT